MTTEELKAAAKRLLAEAVAYRENGGWPDHEYHGLATDMEEVARAYLAVRDAERACDLKWIRVMTETVLEVRRKALERCVETVRAFFKGASSQDDPAFLDPVRQQLSDALVAAIRSLAPAAVGAWSKEPPTVPGYWWWRLSESHEPEIVSLLRYGDRLLIGHVFGADVSRTEGEWAGPLIPPPAPRPRPESAP